MSTTSTADDVAGLMALVRGFASAADFPVLLRLLAQGRPVELERIAVATGRTAAEVDELLAGPPTLELDGRAGLIPDGVVVSRDLPAQAIADLRTAACVHGHFFSSAAASARWREAHPRGEVRSLAEEFAHVLAFVDAAGWRPDAG